MSTPFADIPLALIAAYRAGLFFSDADTAYPNAAFIKPANSVTPWARLDVLPAQPNSEFYDSNEHTGFMQISIMYPLKTGAAQSWQMADDIAAHFRAGSRFKNNSQSVQIVSCGAAPPLVDNGWSMTPITIQYRSMAAR